jgi:hypothetical protein
MMRIRRLGGVGRGGNNRKNSAARRNQECLFHASWRRFLAGN